MADSVGRRVAIRYSVLFSLIAIAIGIAVYASLQRDAYSRLDAAARSLLDLAVSSMDHEWQEHGEQSTAESSFQDVVRSVYQNSFPQEQLALWNGTRLLIYKSNNGHSQSDLRLAPLPRRKGVISWRDLRIVTTQFSPPNSQAHYQIAVSTWRGDTLNDLATLSRSLALIIPFSIVCAALGGYVLARRTLAPLARIIDGIDGITPNTLGAALPVPDAPEEVRRLAGRFNNLLARLQHAFHQRQQFMADASHELRTPVSAALTAAQVTLRAQERSREQYREALIIVEEQMLRLRRIVEDMFLLAHADAAAFPVRAEELYLDELIAEAARAMRLLSERSSVCLSIAHPLPEARLQGDPGLLRQAIIILLDNACKYNRPGGRVLISLDADPDRYIVRVKDTGTGIPAAAHELIFERFYRLDTARGFGQTNGSGLGLAIARWVATQHRGELILESSGDNGSVFKLSLPVPKPATGKALLPSDQTANAST